MKIKKKYSYNVNVWFQVAVVSLISGVDSVLCRWLGSSSSVTTYGLASQLAKLDTFPMQIWRNRLAFFLKVGYIDALSSWVLPFFGIGGCSTYNS